jgi:hypothetical protein
MQLILTPLVLKLMERRRRGPERNSFAGETR